MGAGIMDRAHGMNQIVNYGMQTSFVLGRRLLTGVVRLPFVAGTVAAGVGAVTGHLLYGQACQGLGEDRGAEAARPEARAS
jgi:hypothetical protein